MKRISLLAIGLCLMMVGCTPAMELIDSSTTSIELPDELAAVMTQQFFADSLADPDTTYELTSEEFKTSMTLDEFKGAMEVIPYVAYEDFIFDRVWNTKEYVMTSTGDGMASTSYVYGEMVVTDLLNAPTNVHWVYDAGETRWEVAGVNVTNPYE